MSAANQFAIAKASSLALVEKLSKEISKDVLRVDTVSSGSLTQSTVGILLLGTHVDNVLFGGPAQTEGIERNDEIIEVDGIPAKNDNVSALLIGSDIPASPVKVVYAKGGPQGERKTAVLVRMATSEIQDRRRMFELFRTIQDRAAASKDEVAIEAAANAVELWKQMWNADHVHDSKIAEKVQEVQINGSKLVSELTQSIQTLGRIGDALAGPASVAVPPSPLPPSGAAGVIGLTLDRDAAGTFTVSKVSAGGAAAQSGCIAVGDALLAVDGQPVTGLTAEGVYQLIRGAEGTSLQLGLRRGASYLFNVALTRRARPAAAAVTSYLG
mmetsp:Transcript_24033/g.64505  ORF Transcript_24033/g.64505 Transcript_24033/m.64505 type:complete len:327 (+) Transcript_24033:37-1017(+)